jgi:hypothetical protein
MTDKEPSKEEQILHIMRQVLTSVAKDTYARPGYRHPLSEATMQGIRDCLALISARERELSLAAGRPSKARPRFPDEPSDGVVVTLEPHTKAPPKGRDPD